MLPPYQHNTILYKKKDKSKLKTIVTIGAPTYDIFIERFDESDAAITKIQYWAHYSATEDSSRNVIRKKEFSWKNTPTARTVTTEVYDRHGRLQSTRSIHTDDANQY